MTIGWLDAAASFTPAASTEADPRIERAKPNVAGFLWLAAQLTLLLAVFRVFRVEQFSMEGAKFFVLACVVFGAFAIHYWLPFHLKEQFWIAVCLLATGVFLPLRVALALIGAGAAFYVIWVSHLTYRVRVALVAAAFGAAMLPCAHPGLANRLLGPFHVPISFWQIFGSVFMFRMIVYAHDVRHMKGRPSLREYLAYFFVLPNYYFLLFPVIDFQTMRLGYYRRDIHAMAQQGIAWILRGTLQLLMYRVVASLHYMQMMSGTRSLASVIGLMLLTFLLYLRVSGEFHIIIGMLHLFGYDLPETNHKYLLTRSMTDFWRRINIYWKDFMVKIVYFPVYFRLRKKGDLRARILATAMVFLATWALHAYQGFWLSRRFGFSWSDTIFWSVLGAAIVVNVWLEGVNGRRPASGGWRANLRTAASVAGSVAFIIALWSLWSAPTLGAWIKFIQWWRPAAELASL